MGEYRHYRKGSIERCWLVIGNKVNVTIEIDGVVVCNPSVEQIEADGWVEFTPTPTPPYEPTYEERVVALIREQYNENDELKYARWSRHEEELTDEEEAEMEAFDAYVVDCHERAKEE